MNRRLVLLLSFISFFISSLSYAAISRSYNYIYFDGSGNIIGQKFMTCENHLYQAGTVDGANPYRLQVSYGCGDSGDVCDPETGICKPTKDDWAIKVEYFDSPIGVTKTEICSATYVAPNGLSVDGACSGPPYDFIKGL